MDNLAMAEAYRRAFQRLLLLDYDGVLAPIKPLPEQASPNPRMITLLKKLAADPANTCVIVSGRDRGTLDAWLGGVPLGFAAEHGLWRKEEGKTWEPALPVATEWKQPVRELMRRYEAMLDGSFIEEKYAGVALHYRTVKAASASGQVAGLVNDLEPLAGRWKLRIVHGKKVVEIIPAGVDKGKAAQFWLEGKKWDFILAAGDDVTDEALFRTLPEGAYGVKVGAGATEARFRVPSQEGFVRLLEKISG